MPPAVFLDRDNTLIHNDGDLGDPAEVRLIQGVAPAIASLCGLGYKIVVITNQGGVARGSYTEADVEAVHERLAELVRSAVNGARIDRFYYCPYHPEGRVKKYKQDHPTRKPKPGMLLQAARDMGLDLKQSWTIGDQLRDMQAGAAAGTRTILVRPDADRITPKAMDKMVAEAEAGNGGGAASGGGGGGARPGFVATNLVEAVRIIAQQRTPESADDAARKPPIIKKWDAAAVAQLQRPRATPASEQPTEDADVSVAAVVPKMDQAMRYRPVGAPPPREDKAIPLGRKAEPVTPPEEPAAPAPPPPVQPVADADLASEGAEKSLRLILQELRQQRGMAGDFTNLRLLAMVTQMMALICLLAALWLGSSDIDLFIRWIMTAVLAQLATIALILFSRA